MSISFLPAHHLLLRENAEDGAADFDDDGTVLTIIDDHSRAFDQPEPHLLSIALPKDVVLLRDLERYIPRIREHSLSDAYEAVREVLLARGIPETTADRILEDARAIAEQERVPAGWMAWATIPRGSLSTFGDGQWLLRWPEATARRLDAARFEYVDVAEPDNITGPEFTFDSQRPSVPWVRVYRTGLTAEQIQAFLASPVLQHKTPADAFEQMFPTAEAA